MSWIEVSVELTVALIAFLILTIKLSRENSELQKEQEKQSYLNMQLQKEIKTCAEEIVNLKELVKKASELSQEEPKVTKNVKRKIKKENIEKN